MIDQEIKMTALKKDDLAPFVLKDVSGLEQGEERGSGAYGFVRTVTVRGAKCIAKRMHDILHDKEVPPLQQQFIRKKFRDECKMLSELRHPNIVVFVGVHYGKSKDDISLIMEALHTDLNNFIKKAATPIPLSLKLSILFDVTYGLLYLHTYTPSPIIHRDLNVNNILLTEDLRAKIADLGVSKFLDMTKRKSQTIAPGAWDYMPPEAMVDDPTYNTSLDIFSFGHVMLCVGNQDIPALTLKGGSGKSLHGNVEIKRRKKYLDVLGEKHCLYPLVIQSLQDSANKRPTTRELCDRLQKLCVAYPRCVADVLKVVGMGKGEIVSVEGWKGSSCSMPCFLCVGGSGVVAQMLH